MSQSNQLHQRQAAPHYVLDDNWLDFPQERLRQQLAIAYNPSTSIEQLQRLSQDARDLIRDIASQKILD